MIDVRAIESKWQRRWNDAKLFEVDAKAGKKKFFATFPYPYINSYPHIGHLYTIMRVEALTRFKRLQNYHVLFPQAWHATGSPILNAAKRVAEREEKQIKIMKSMGIDKKEFSKFEEPSYWIEFFAPEFEKDFRSIGLSIDWRRNFFTTSLNPHYDAFIRWQFRKLREKNYIVKGKFPVVWCPKCQTTANDHGRIKGEGETPQEFVLVKHKHIGTDDYLVTATMRIETILGITNIWINPNIVYARVFIDNETWIISKDAVKKLKEQDKNIKILNEINGKEFVGTYVKEFNGRKVIILPGIFVEANIGTGIVHSVPSDSPDDWIALRDLQEHPEQCEKYGLDYNTIEEIRVIPVLHTPGYGETPAMQLCEEYDVTCQKDTKQLIEARKALYKKSFYESTMNSLYRDFFGNNLEGMPVTEAKEIIKVEMLKRNCLLFYELTGPVICRCLTPCISKTVTDQWFVAYGDYEWKHKAHQCLNRMRLYPNEARQQFDYVLDWLRNWACTREEGLGTALPWDEKWLIESLSDSTIYMAYYTFAHLIIDIDPQKLDDAFFDYVFFGKGKINALATKYGVSTSLLEKIRNEYLYWYPLDFRNSGKDLIQNHLAFFIFNHVALFPEDKWPLGIGVNGWITVDGEKMSKSLGNMIPLREMREKFSVDSSRFTILSGGEGLDDPNWDSTFAKAFMQKLNTLHSFCVEHYGKGRETSHIIDGWMESKLHEIVRDTTTAMEETMFRTATQLIFFELQYALKWYMKRCHNEPNKKLIKEIVEKQLIMLSVFCPHICEEIWEVLGKKSFISVASWPVVDEKKIRKDIIISELIIRNVMKDVIKVLKLIKKNTPTKITFFVALPWKYHLFHTIRKMMIDTRNPKIILQHVMSDQNMKQYGGVISGFLPKIVSSGNIVPFLKSDDEEVKVLHHAKQFFEEEFGCTVEIIKASSSGHHKARQAFPGKPAILIE